jgi:hypothetical protein
VLDEQGLDSREAPRGMVFSTALGWRF